MSSIFSSDPVAITAMIAATIALAAALQWMFKRVPNDASPDP
jgi:hypothetical protein